MPEAHDRTASGLDLFLEWAGRTGEMNESTSKALRTTVSKVLAVREDGTESDVTALDVERLLSRWETLNKTNYSSGSLQTYKSRFRQAVAMYSAWVLNDPDWKAAAKPKHATEGSRPERRKLRPKPEARSTALPSQPEPSTPTTPGVRLVGYDLPLRPDLLVRLSLPVDLTSDDARRISAFVSSLAFANPAPTGEGTAPTGEGG